MGPGDKSQNDSFEKIRSILTNDFNFLERSLIGIEKAEELIEESGTVAMRYHSGSSGKISENVDYVITLNDRNENLKGTSIGEVDKAVEILKATISSPDYLSNERKKSDYADTINKYFKEVDSRRLISTKAEEGINADLHLSVDTVSDVYKIESNLENQGSIVVEGSTSNNLY
jgi:hypothetical protein